MLNTRKFGLGWEQKDLRKYMGDQVNKTMLVLDKERI